VPHVPGLFAMVAHYARAKAFHLSWLPCSPLLVVLWTLAVVETETAVGAEGAS
jgi:hypothetical protein